MPKVRQPDSVQRRAYSRSLIEAGLARNRMTQKELAKRLDIADSTASVYRKEPERMPVGFVVPMAKALGWSDAETLSFIMGTDVKAYTLEDIKELLSALCYPAQAITDFGRRTG